jgi:hypothetical protein
MKPVKASTNMCSLPCAYIGKHMVVDTFDTAAGTRLEGPLARAPCHHGDDVEDRLSKCETIFACLEYDVGVVVKVTHVKYDSDWSNFDDNTDIDLTVGRIG